MHKILLKKKIMSQQRKHNAAAEVATNESTVDVMTSRDFHGDIHAHIGTIGQLIKDKPHCQLYRNTILYNKHLFKGRTVLNIGCSVGLLALFAAQADAACVYAVDESNAVDYARRVIKANNYEHVIKLYKSNIKQLQLPVQQVDIIICDWCGYSMLFESQCAAVIYARDKWLKPNGVILPDVAKLYLGGFEDARHKHERFNWWMDVYGFNMKALRASALQEPCYQQVHPQQVLSSVYPVYTLNLNKATLQDLKFRSKFLLHINVSGNMDGVFTYFDMCFSKSHTPAYISTAPTQPCTRWLQALFFFDEPLTVQKDAELCGGFEMFPLQVGDMHNMHVGLELLSEVTNEDLNLEVATFWLCKSHYLRKTNQNEEQQPEQLPAATQNGTNSEIAQTEVKAVAINKQNHNNNNNNNHNNNHNNAQSTKFYHHQNNKYAHNNKRYNRGNRTQANAKNNATALQDTGLQFQPQTQHNKQRGRYFKKSKN